MRATMCTHVTHTYTIITCTYATCCNISYSAVRSMPPRGASSADPRFRACLLQRCRGGARPQPQTSSKLVFLTYFSQSHIFPNWLSRGSRWGWGVTSSPKAFRSEVRHRELLGIPRPLREPSGPGEARAHRLQPVPVQKRAHPRLTLRPSCERGLPRPQSSGVSSISACSSAAGRSEIPRPRPKLLFLICMCESLFFSLSLYIYIYSNNNSVYIYIYIYIYIYTYIYIHIYRFFLSLSLSQYIYIYICIYI